MEAKDQSPESTWISRRERFLTNFRKGTISTADLVLFAVLWALLIWASAGIAGVANALTIVPEVCGSIEKIRSYVPNDRVAGWGLSDKGKLISLLLGPNNQFSIIFQEPRKNGLTCFLATGREWEVLN